MVIYQWSDLTEVGGQLGNFAFFPLCGMKRWSSWLKLRLVLLNLA